MATRLYLANVSPDAEISGFSVSGIGGWNGGAGISFASTIHKKATTVKSATNVSVAAGSGTTNPHNRLWALYTSSPLSAQSIAGTIKGQIRAAESFTSDNAFPQLRVRIMNGDGSVQRGVLLDFNNAALSNEFATSLTNRGFPRAHGGGLSLSSVDAQAGDRLFIEVGLRKESTSGATLTMDFRDDNATDLPENETETGTLNSWVEFSQTLLFQGAGGGGLRGAGRMTGGMQSLSGGMG